MRVFQFLKAHWFQVAVVALLVLVYLEISGGRQSLSEEARSAYRAIFNIGKPEEVVISPRGPTALERQRAEEFERGSVKNVGKPEEIAPALSGARGGILEVHKDAINEAFEQQLRASRHASAPN